MNILSYRGPAAPGGVSSALERIFQYEKGNSTNWCFLKESKLEMLSCNAAASKEIAFVNLDLVDAHYRYCNDFLWPVVHDMPEYAYLNYSDRLAYFQFNMRFARSVLRRTNSASSRKFFVNDYQLAPMAALMTDGSKFSELSLFWHIPWPRFVKGSHIECLGEIAEALLGAGTLGFHTDEYAANFLRFVSLNLNAYKVDFKHRVVHHRAKSVRKTTVTVCPLGLDIQYWSREAGYPELEHLSSKYSFRSDIPLVFSVDRADYTKGLRERLHGIDAFFAAYPEWIEKVQFVQVCQRSRAGLPAFDNYWNECKELFRNLNMRWGSSSWQPLRWIQDPCTASELQGFYKGAAVMLVNPRRDGLNLTAKEFVACSRDGVLLLSPETGVWSELSDYAISLDATSAESFAGSIEQSLRMSILEKRQRMRNLKSLVAANSLQQWWRRFQEVSDYSSLSDQPILA
ncbi:MAG: trehalose-6-phosphate synthase [Candidatus Obscuribacterales bacterium]|nr:trehalose-6-phosphate synthase [Candidatus Obscuribacterales bacterium]